MSRFGLACVVSALVLVGCGDGEDGRAVRSEVISDPSTQAVRVFAPEETGSWPVVLALHGLDGSGEDLAELASQLAGEGFVVFAPTYRSEITTEEGFVETARDVECGYRFARSVAAEYGGDLDQPVVFLGWSLGASFAVQGGLDEEIDPSGQYISCFAEVPRADVIVSVSGCYYEYEGRTGTFLDPVEWTNRPSRIAVLAGAEDDTCDAQQSRDLVTQLQDAGYDAALTVLDGAEHQSPVADPEVRDEVVQAVVDAVAGGSG